MVYYGQLSLFFVWLRNPQLNCSERLPQVGFCWQWRTVTRRKEWDLIDSEIDLSEDPCSSDSCIQAQTGGPALPSIPTGQLNCHDIQIQQPGAHSQVG